MKIGEEILFFIRKLTKKYFFIIRFRFHISKTRFKFLFSQKRKWNLRQGFEKCIH